MLKQRESYNFPGHSASSEYIVFPVYLLRVAACFQPPRGALRQSSQQIPERCRSYTPSPPNILAPLQEGPGISVFPTASNSSSPQVLEGNTGYLPCHLCCISSGDCGQREAEASPGSGLLSMRHSTVHPPAVSTA